MGKRWAILTPPLLCGVLADVCLVLFALRPPGSLGDAFLILGIVVVTIGIAVVWEFYRWRRDRGWVERRSIRFKGTVHSAFVIPVSPHLYTGVLLLSLLLVGLSLATLILETFQIPNAPTDAPRPPMEAALGLGLMMTFFGVWWVLRGSRIHDLILLPDGVLLPYLWLGCFLPWELIDTSSAVRLSLLWKRGPTLLGLRVKEVDRVEVSTKTRRLMTTWADNLGWHCFVPMVGMTLSVEQVARIVSLYVLHPEHRSSIGTQLDLGQLCLALTPPGKGSGP